jgi:hypothetical protein
MLMSVFWVVILYGLVALKIKPVHSCETLVSTYKSTWHHKTESQYQHLHLCENLISSI